MQQLGDLGGRPPFERGARALKLTEEGRALHERTAALLSELDETAAVGLNLPLAGGMIGADKRPTYSPDTISDVTRDVHAQAIRELHELALQRRLVVLVAGERHALGRRHRRRRPGRPE